MSPSNEYRTLIWTDPGWELRDLEGMVLSFDSTGRWTSSEDRNGNRKTACYDSAPACDGPGPLISVDLPDQRREQYTYHPSGKLATITEVGVGGSSSRTWSLTWSLGNQGDELAELKSPDGTILRFVYTVLGRPSYISRMDLEETHPSGSSDLPNRVLRGWEYDD